MNLIKISSQTNQLITVASSRQPYSSIDELLAQRSRTEPIVAIYHVGHASQPIEYNPSPTWVSITDLTEDCKLICPLVVKVERSEGNVFLAECPTFDLFAPGETYEEALDGLKSLLFDDYNILLSAYPQNLSPASVKILRLYSAFSGKEL